MAQAICISDTIKVPYSNIEISKDSFGLFVVFIDLLVIFSILIFIYVLDTRQNEYIQQFNKNTV